MSLDDTDPGFLEDLRNSHRHVLRVATWLNAKGYEVNIPPVRERPNPEQMADYADDGDLCVVQRVECKRRQVDFTDEASYPYGTVIVDVAHAWDRARPKPFAYIISNRGETHACIVMGHTSPEWRRVTRRDQAKGRLREFLECPKSMCVFMPMQTAEPVRA